MSQIPKQAVLLIHGIGEQRPMDTLRGFVDAVWKRNPDVHHAHATTGVFSKPDDISGSYELRRLTTTKDRNGVRTDFFEFYWAHMMEDTTMGHVLPWLKHLLLRRPGSLPQCTTKRVVGALRHCARCCVFLVVNPTARIVALLALAKVGKWGCWLTGYPSAGADAQKVCW